MNLIQDTLLYFKHQGSIIDLAIIILGIVLLLMQILLRLSNSGKRFFKRAEKDLLNVRRTEIQLGIISTLIEMLPYLGILGTVWGLMQGLYVIQNHTDPTIKLIASKLAPALSSTFLGLAFAILNHFIFNFLAAYIMELSAAYQLYYDKSAASGSGLLRPRSGVSSTPGGPEA